MDIDGWFGTFTSSPKAISKNIHSHVGFLSFSQEENTNKNLVINITMHIFYSKLLTSYIHRWKMMLQEKSPRDSIRYVCPFSKCHVRLTAAAAPPPPPQIHTSPVTSPGK